MEDAEALDYLIDSLREMTVISTTGRWVRFGDIAVWVAELMRLNGPLLRPIGVEGQNQDVRLETEDYASAQ